MELSLSFVRTFCFYIFIVRKYRSTYLLCTVYFEKEQTNHNVYDETGMNEICSMYSHMLIRFQCWLDLYRLQTLHFWQ